MTPALRSSARHWLAGLALAAVGVCVNRGLAPLFDTRPKAVVALLGELIALGGLAVIMVGIRRRLRRDGEAASAAMTVASSPEVSPKDAHLLP